MLVLQRARAGSLASEEFSVEPVLLVPAESRDLNLSRAREWIVEAFEKSTQLGVAIALYLYCRRFMRGARPKDLYEFLRRMGVSIRDSVLRAELRYLARKGLVWREGGRYRVREDIRLKDIEALIDLGRAKAGRTRWEDPKRRDWRPKHSLDPEELLKKYNIHNLREHIKSLIRRDERRALATLIVLGGGLRPSDYPTEIGFRQNEFYAVVYEPKCDRYRLVTEEHDVLWRELLRDEEIRDWLARLLSGTNRRRYRSDDDLMELWATCTDKKLKPKARRIYLAYQNLYYGSAQARVLTTLNGKQVIAGLHLDPSSDLFYITR
ncbi:MAG: hypothetical protein J7L51_02970 [Desulfurococcales archaeon]|nr:hypothetical protein [Desulfurococcales archaeon]